MRKLNGFALCVSLPRCSWARSCAAKPLRTSC